MGRRFMATTGTFAAVVVLVGVGGWMLDGPRAAVAVEAPAAEPACSVASLQGHYGVLFQGFAAGAPFHGTGVIHFDGTARMSARFDEMVNGVLDSSTSAGDYEVHGDCTGSVQLTEHRHQRAPDHLHRASIVVVDGGREGFLLLVDTQFPGEGPPGAPEPSFTISGTFKRF